MGPWTCTVPPQVNEVQLHGATSGKFSGFAPARLPAPSPPLMIPALYSCGAAAKLPIRWGSLALAPPRLGEG